MNRTREEVRKRVCGYVCASGYERDDVQILGGTLDQAEQQKTAASDRNNFNPVAAIGQQLAEHFQGCFEGL
ncbi:MAG TPA: hypothetical protein VI197_03600 [Polyangiaceae bacterium]